MKKLRVVAAGVATRVAVTAWAAGVFLSGCGARETAHAAVGHVCPMHPAQVADRPGRCLVCGMDLVPVRAPRVDGAASGAVVIYVSGERRQLIGLRLATVARAPLQHTLRLLGRVRVDEARDHPVIAGADGWIQDVAEEATTGRVVRRGQPLATVFGREYTTAQRTFLYALRAMVEMPQTDIPIGGFQERREVALEEARFDLMRMGVGDAEIQAITETRQVRLHVTLAAPADGVVLERAAYPGQSFAPGARLFRVADLSRVWIVAEAFAEEATHLTAGGEVTLVLPDANGTTQPATVSEALPEYDAVARVHRVRLEAENPGLQLRPGMFVDVLVPVEHAAAIHVPAEAVIDSGRRQVVFAAQGDDGFVAREVRTGWRNNGRIVIEEGLEPGETIVVSGNFLLDSERRLGRAGMAQDD